MAKRVYIGDTENIARKISKAYLGIDNIARKIKKAYIGIGDVARPCWSSDKFEYYGTITPLSSYRQFVDTITINDIALFAGGRHPGGTNDAHVDYQGIKTIDRYNKSLTKLSSVNFSQGRFRCGITAVGNYAIFACGSINEWVTQSYTTSVEAYDGTTGTMIMCTNYVDTPGLCDIGATTVGNYAVFAGGAISDYVNNTPYGTSMIVFYNDSLTRSASSSTLYDRARSISATTVGNYAVFAGGCSKNSSNVASLAYIYSCNSSLTINRLSNILSPTRAHSDATTVGNYAVFAGGWTGKIYNSPTKLNSLICFNKSLTTSSAANLSKASCNLSASTIDDHAIFITNSTFDVYDESLVKTTGDPLRINHGDSNVQSSRSRLICSAVLGKYLLVSGYGSSAVEAYISNV